MLASAGMLSFGTMQSVQAQNILDQMAVKLKGNTNREVSFANKKSAYYLTQTQANTGNEYEYFEGMNIAKKRIFSGFSLFVDGQQLENGSSTVTVYPYKMNRSFANGAQSVLWLHDFKNVVEVDLSSVKGKRIGIHLKGIDAKNISAQNNLMILKSIEGNHVIAVAPRLGSINSGKLEKDQLTASASAKGFFIAVGKTADEAMALLKEARKNSSRWKKERKERISKLLEKNTYFKSSDKQLEESLNWMSVTMDQLVSEQQGYGIYAGLPWFNEYWGRDEFISMPGAVLVSGQFKWAKDILKSFAEYQNTDPNSKFFGRVPNIVNPDAIDYHTTDGTPRFVIELYDYVQYSGDMDLIKELYPNVKNSIEGALKNWTDDSGYLLHANNETWMDARRNYDKRSYSPRGTRANDIQALWYKQLQAGAYFARVIGDTANEQKWEAVAEKVKKNFDKDYRDPSQKFLADRLDPLGIPEFKLRPNQLFAYDLVNDQDFKLQMTKICWEEFVYPWGTSSLNRQDLFFHPFHLAWRHYHKDEAYHNGTIWLWLNGIAMQRMIESGQSDVAYQLFQNMNQQAMNRGVVGGLSENMDCYPHEGKLTKLTGTYLQAWSNAEHLRVWNQYFLGVRPDMIAKTLTLAPRLPKDINDLEYKSFIGEGYLKGTYNKAKQSYTYQFHDIDTEVNLDVWPFNTQKIKVKSGDVLTVIQKGEQLEVHVKHHGRVKQSFTLKKNADRLATAEKQAEVFKGVKFCEPMSLDHHRVMQKTFKGRTGF